MRTLGAVTFPHSLGMYYTAITQYLGFWKFGDEYKVMGLAAYGEPAFLEEFRRIVRADGPLGFRLGLEYFAHQRQGADMSWRESDKTPVLGRFFRRLSGKAAGAGATSGSAGRASAKDLAATLQARSKKFCSQLNALHASTKQKASLPRRRRGVQLPGQRKNFRAHAV